MPGRPLSITKKKQNKRSKFIEVRDRAVHAYKEELAKVSGKPRGVRAICNQVTAEYLKETGVHIKLCYKTVFNLAKGSQSIDSFNNAKCLLTEAEVDTVIDYAVELSARGFPLSHRRLEEHVNEILGSRLGPSFRGVGKNWSDRFVERHSDRLDTYYSRPLNSSRGQAVNPNTHAAYIDILKTILTTGDNGNPIAPECTHAQDETGFTPSSGEKERVIGGKGKSIQHQARNGTKENITVMVTICADGSAIPPAVIFKGQAYQVNWKQNNPANAS